MYRWYNSFVVKQNFVLQKYDRPVKIGLRKIKYKGKYLYIKNVMEKKSNLKIKLWIKLYMIKDKLKKNFTFLDNYKFNKYQLLKKKKFFPLRKNKRRYYRHLSMLCREYKPKRKLRKWEILKLIKLGVYNNRTNLFNKNKWQHNYINNSRGNDYIYNKNKGNKYKNNIINENRYDNKYDNRYTNRYYDKFNNKFSNNINNNTFNNSISNKSNFIYNNKTNNKYNNYKYNNKFNNNSLYTNNINVDIRKNKKINNINDLNHSIKNKKKNNKNENKYKKNNSVIINYNNKNKLINSNKKINDKIFNNIIIKLKWNAIEKKSHLKWIYFKIDKDQKNKINKITNYNYYNILRQSFIKKKFILYLVKKIQNKKKKRERIKLKYKYIKLKKIRDNILNHLKKDKNLFEKYKHLFGIKNNIIILSPFYKNAYPKFTVLLTENYAKQYAIKYFKPWIEYWNENIYIYKNYKFKLEKIK
jgi:hypothetical protein